MATNNIEELVAERLAQLPKVVRDAIASSDIEKHLRSIADTYKLHLDQWQKLEDQVMMTLLAVHAPEELAQNIETEIGVSADMAKTLAADINAAVFQPIREELERQLDHPQAEEEKKTDVETMRDEMLASKEAVVPPAVNPVATVVGTPGTPPPTDKAVREPPPATYTPAQPSTERKEVIGDPYREQVK